MQKKFISINTKSRRNEKGRRDPLNIISVFGNSTPLDLLVGWLVGWMVKTFLYKIYAEGMTISQNKVGRMNSF